MSEREKFEAWVIAERYSPTILRWRESSPFAEGGYYENASADLMWRGWNAKAATEDSCAPLQRVERLKQAISNVEQLRHNMKEGQGHPCEVCYSIADDVMTSLTALLREVEEVKEENNG